jgi:hypothetical protein
LSEFPGHCPHLATEVPVNQQEQIRLFLKMYTLPGKMKNKMLIEGMEWE